MTDTLSILRHPTASMAKTWRADGTIGAYDDAKFFTLTEQQVDSITALSAVLTALEARPDRCIIRGRYVGADLAASRDPEFKPGRVRRALDYFDDQPLHTLLIDVDKFTPLSVDAITDPEEAIEEFVWTQLPEAFRGVTYHWQLSNSHGHPSKGAELRAHLWFWLDQPLTSAQVKAWALAQRVRADVALFNPVQVHYTAAPLFENGVQAPTWRRSGLAPGVMADEVELALDAAEMAAASSGGGRGARLREVASTDRIAVALADAGLVKSQRTDGALNIDCLFKDGHSGDSGETATVYYPPNTGGYSQGNFKCLHASCAARTRGMFLARLGIDEVADEFGVLPADGGESEHGEAAVRKGIPEAQHLTTDQANAGRIAARFGRKLIVVAGQWYAWDGRRWVKDEGEVYRYACMLSKIIRGESDAWKTKRATSADEAEKFMEIADALEKWARASEMKKAIDAAVGLVKKMLAVSETLIDANPWLLNCLNGVVDLRTGTLKPHDPTDYITKLVALEYDPTARSPQWQQVLARVTLEEERTTRPLASFLQRWFGYCCTGSTREQVFVVHYGQGSNGKSTILDTIAEVMGDYSATAAPGLMVGTGKDRHPTEVADLFGRRMVTAHETSEGGVLREEFVKQATGGDRIKARYMRADFFEFAPTHKLQLLTNHKPIVKGQDHGIWRRVLLVPFAARFGAHEEVVAGRAHYIKDTRIAERLRGEMQGVLTWLVQGSVQWFQDGLQPPDVVLAASKDYQTEQDRVSLFLTECCEVGPEFEAPLAGDFGGIYPVYTSWCREGGFSPLSKVSLLRELERAVFCFKKIERKEANSRGGRSAVLYVGGVRAVRG